jgi:hypothetical protein
VVIATSLATSLATVMTIQSLTTTGLRNQEAMSLQRKRGGSIEMIPNLKSGKRRRSMISTAKRPAATTATTPLRNDLPPTRYRIGELK